jgi:hypothetical protein
VAQLEPLVSPQLEPTVAPLRVALSQNLEPQLASREASQLAE